MGGTLFTNIISEAEATLFRNRLEDSGVVPTSQDETVVTYFRALFRFSPSRTSETNSNFMIRDAWFRFSC